MPSWILSISLSTVGLPRDSNGKESLQAINELLIENQNLLGLNKL